MSTTARTPAVPGVVQDPFRDRRVACTAAERERPGLTGRRPSAVLTRSSKSAACASSCQQDMISDLLARLSAVGRTQQAARQAGGPSTSDHK